MTGRVSDEETLRLSLELLKRIPRHRKITSTEMHQQVSEAGLVRSKRTIERQLKTLCQHFDIECDNREKPFGYRWKERAKPLSVPTLNAPESLMLTLAEQYLSNLLPSPLMKSIQGFFDQARYELHKEGREREWLNKVRVVSETQPLLAPDIKEGVFEEVSAALYSNCWLALKYCNANGEESDIRVMPLGLAQQGPRLYLVCRYEGYDNERSLALHRILDARTQTIKFVRPSKFDLKKYDEEGHFAWRLGKKVHLSFTISKSHGNHLYETPLSQDQQIIEKDDHLHISATVTDTQRLTWWLRGFGEEVTDVKKTPVT